MVKIDPKIVSKAASYTSLGSKYAYHPEQINNLINNGEKTVISTLVSITNKCNLKCNYCALKEIDRSLSIPVDTVKNFVAMLKEHGLKSVMITGGGEPTSHPQFNELVSWLKNEKLDIGLVTNGTLGKAVKDWDSFTWVRASLNFKENGSLLPINIPAERKGDLGFSLVYQGQNLDTFETVQRLVDNLNGKYVRVVPDSSLPKDKQTQLHEQIGEILEKMKDPRFFLHSKLPKPAQVKECLLSRLRPYLNPKGVFPCDILEFNKDQLGRVNHNFHPKFNLLPDKNNPMSYEKVLSGEFKPLFEPKKDCTNCYFSENAELLEQFKNEKISDPAIDAVKIFDKLGIKQDENVAHKNFV